MVVAAPWESWDGSHRRQPRSRRGNYYIRTYLDHFTMFVEAYPILNKEAETICRVLAIEIFQRFGVPIQLLTDQGWEFDNRLVKGLSEVNGIDNIRTSPYRPSTIRATEPFIGHSIPCCGKMLPSHRGIGISEFRGLWLLSGNCP